MKLSTLVTLVLLLGIFFSSASIMTYSASPPGYAYVKSHVISGSVDGALTDYQVKVVVHSGTGTDSGQDVYLNGHSLSWPNDIRFTNNADALLSYWVESYDANAATVWVKVDSIPVSSGSATIKLYYGKAGETSASNGANTFILFDDFNSINTGLWSTSAANGGSYSATGGSLQVSSITQSGSYGALTTISNYPVNNVAVGAKYRLYVSTRGYDGAANFECSGSYIFMPTTANTWDLNTHSYTWLSADDDDCYRFSKQGTQVYQDNVIRPTSWSGWITSEVRTTNSNILAFKNGAQVYSGTFAGFSNAPYKIRADGQGPNNYGTQYLQTDYVYIRKYTQNEPAQSVWGAETSTSGPTPTPTPTPTPSPIPGYAYVKTHVISGSIDGALTDYQVKVVVHSGTGTDSGQDVYLNGHSLSWPNDIRFTNSADALLSYWVESYDANTATVWVKVDSIPASSGTATIKLYYGKASETSASNGANTLLAYDDFSTNRIGTYWDEMNSLSGAWTYETTHVVENGGYHLARPSAGDSAGYLQLKNALSVPSVSVVTLTYTSLAGRSPPWVYMSVDDGGASNRYCAYNFGYWGGTVGGFNPSSPSDTLKIEWTDGATTNNLKMYRNGAIQNTQSVNFGTLKKPTFGLRTAGSEYINAYFKSFYSYKYTANPPSQGAWGAETSTTTPTPTPTPTSTPIPTWTPPSSYSYAKTQTIRGSTDGPLTDYQMMFTIHKGIGTDSGQSVYLNGHSLNWPYDIQFTDKNNSLLNYWIESNDSNNANVWVKIPFIPTDPATTTVNLYYGNANDTGASNGSSTFTFFDNMADLSQWTVSGATTDGNAMNVIGGQYAMTTGAFDTRSTAYRCRIYSAPASNWEKYFGWGGNTNFYWAPDNGFGIWNDYGNMFQRLQYGSGQGSTVAMPAAQWDVYDMYLNNAGTTATVLKNGAQILTGTVSGNQMQKWMMSNNPNCGGAFHLDWLAIRNKTNNEPTQLSWSTESFINIVYNAEYVSDTIPSVMTGCQPYDVSVTMKNTGNTVWSNDTLVRLGVANCTFNDAILFSDFMFNISTGVIVQPGQSYTFNYVIVAPGLPGTYNLSYQMFRHNNGSFGGIYNETVTVQTIPNAVYMSDNIPSTMNAGESYNVSITMGNAGSLLWFVGNNISLGGINGLSGDAAKFSSVPVNMLQNIVTLRNQSYTFNFTMTAPLQGGTYNPQYRMVQNGNEWFGETLSKNINVIPRFDAVLVSDEIPSSVTRGGYVNVRVIVRNTGTQTWYIANGHSENHVEMYTTYNSMLLWWYSGVDVAIAPGQTCSFQGQMDTSMMPGTYNARYQLHVYDGNGNVYYFGPSVMKTYTITEVLPTPTPTPPAPTPTPTPVITPTPTPRPGFTQSLVVVIPSTTSRPPIFIPMPTTTPPQMYTQTKTYPIDWQPSVSPLPQKIYYQNMTNDEITAFKSNTTCANAVSRALDRLNGQSVIVAKNRYAQQQGQHEIDIVPADTVLSLVWSARPGSPNFQKITTLVWYAGGINPDANLDLGGGYAENYEQAQIYGILELRKLVTGEYAPKTAEQMKFDLSNHIYVDVYSFC